MTSATKKAAAAATAMIGAMVATAAAQDGIEPTRQFQLNLSQEFNATENQAQDPDSAGTTLNAITRLGFEATVLNELNQLDFNASSGFRFSDVPVGSSVQEVDQPRLNLRYQRTGATSNLSLRANYRRDDIAFLRPLEEFIDEEGVLIVPDDINDLDGTGTRIDYGSNLQFQVRQDAPISLSFRLGINGRQYEDVTDPDLADEETVSGSTSVQFRFTQDFLGTFTYGRSSFTAEDDVATQRDRENVSFRLEKALSQVLTGSITIGETTVETETTEGTRRVQGGNGGASLTLDRPNGTIGLVFDNTTNDNGTRQSLVLRRSFLLRDGTLSGSLGVTEQVDGGRDPIGSLRYLQALPTGSMSFSFERSVRFIESDGEDREINSFSARYNHDINQLSSVTLRAAATQSDDTERASLGAAYNYDLTEDWRLSTGYDLDLLSEDNSDWADRHRVFVRLSRRFDLPF